LCKRANGDPIVKVFDFGVAKLDDDEKLTRTEAVMGTAAYMSPEQARRAADAGPLADVYSIGAVLYHMLTGQMPYGNVPAISRFALVLHEEPDRPRSLQASIPAGVEADQHAMARETKTRLQTADDFEASRPFDAPSARPSLPTTTSAAHAIEIAVRASPVRSDHRRRGVEPRDRGVDRAAARRVDRSDEPRRARVDGPARSGCVRGAGRTSHQDPATPVGEHHRDRRAHALHGAVLRPPPGVSHERSA
jgi:serine/threonine-protein kinase